MITKINGKKDTEDNNNTSSGHYTLDSSDAKEIMTGIGGGGEEGEGSTYPDSDKYIVEDIKKAIKEEDSGFEEKEEKEGSAKHHSEQSNNKDENN